MKELNERKDNPSAALHGGGEQVFTTQDLDLASYFGCLGIKPLEVKPPLRNSFPNFATFVFALNDSVNAAIDQWSSDEPLSLDLREFLAKRHENYRLVRSLRGGGR